MTYKIKMSCGHTQNMVLYGPQKLIEEKIKYFKTRAVCVSCHMKQQLEKNIAAGYVEVRVPYREYKLRFANLPYIPDSYNKTDRSVIVCLPPEIAPYVIEREEKREKERLEREEKKRIQEQQKAERAAARAAALAAAKIAKEKQKKQELPIMTMPVKPPVPEPPLNLRPPEATLFLKKLAMEFDKKYRVAATELAKQDVRCAYSKLNLFYSSYGKKEWENLVANNDIINLPAKKIVQLAQQIYEKMDKDRYGCVKRA